MFCIRVFKVRSNYIFEMKIDINNQLRKFEESQEKKKKKKEKSSSCDVTIIYHTEQ